MELQLLNNSLAQVPISTQNLLVGEERNFIEALQTKKINELPELDLRNALKYAMLKIGIRAKNFPEGIEKSVLLTHIFVNYGNHTPAEIRLAFDLAILGKLNLNIDEVKCFENFSCQYFSTIMNAYRIWAQQVYDQHKPNEKQIEHKPDTKQIDKEYQDFLDSDLGKQMKGNNLLPKF
jgi:hypothetical protein